MTKKFQIHAEKGTEQINYNGVQWVLQEKCAPNDEKWSVLRSWANLRKVEDVTFELNLEYWVEVYHVGCRW